MSTYADSSKSRLWLDGDAFRAPAETALPADIFAASLVGWDAFGGIQAGFEVERAQDVTKLPIWNKQGTYRQTKGDEDATIRMRPVDMSKATALTLITGGSVAAGGGGFEWIEGEVENFALIVRVLDGSNKMAYYVRKGELSNRPTETLNDEQLMGWDMEITPLVPADGSKPVRRFTTENPLA